MDASRAMPAMFAAICPPTSCQTLQGGSRSQVHTSNQKQPFCSVAAFTMTANEELTACTAEQKPNASLHMLLIRSHHQIGTTMYTRRTDSACFLGVGSLVALS